MNAIAAVFHHEKVLLLRNKFLVLPLLVNLICWGYVIISYEIQPIHYEDRATVFYQSFLWMLLLNLLIIGLFAIYMASKDRDSKFEQLVTTYEIKNVAWIVGKWLNTQLYGLCLTMLTVIVQALWFTSATMSLGDWFKNIFFVFIQMGGAFFLLISIGFFVATLVKSMLAYIVIPALLLISLLFPFDYVGQAYIWDNPKFHLLTPFNFMFITTPFEGVWGILPIFKSTVLHQSVIVLLGILIIAGTLLVFRRNRITSQEKKMISILIPIIIIPALILGGLRFMQYDQALEQYISTGQQYKESFLGENVESYYAWMNSYYDYENDDQTFELAMEKTTLNVNIQAQDFLNVQSRLTIKNNSNEAVDELFLTLYHGLHIEKCTSEKTISCSRDGDFIELHFEQAVQPDETFDVILHYKGNILQYRNDGYMEHAFIENERVYLPKEAGWYPLIGKRSLVIAREHNNLYAQFELRNARLVESYPTQFKVNITRENESLPLTLTIPKMNEHQFQGTSQYGLSLVGGNFKEENVGSIRVVAHPEVFNGAKQVIERYEKAWSFMEEWLEVPMSPSVVYVLSDNYYYQIDHTVNHNLFILRNAAVDDSEIAYELLNDLIVRDGNNESLHVFIDAMTWIILNNFNEQVSFAEWYKSNSWTDDENIELINHLQTYADKGQDDLKGVLKYVFNYWSKLNNKHEFDLTAALKQYEGESKQ